VLDEFAAHVDAVAGGVGVMAPSGRRAATGNTAMGMDLAALIRHGVATSRSVKSSIPTVESHRIPIRHELALELHLHPD
jgi:hypothetical protein